MDAENKKGIGLAALVAIIVSGAIGGGVFNLSNDLATNASPGGVIISWIVIGFGILMLVLSLNHLVVNKPELSGVSDYARAGFGNMVGFISGWRSSVRCKKHVNRFKDVCNLKKFIDEQLH